MALTIDNDWLDRTGITDLNDTSEKIELNSWHYNSEYLERCGLDRETTLNQLKDKLLWGTYGMHREHYPKVKWIKLSEATDTHLRNILITEKQIDNIKRYVIVEILKDRGITVDKKHHPK